MSKTRHGIRTAYAILAHMTVGSLRGHVVAQWRMLVGSDKVKLTSAQLKRAGFTVLETIIVLAISTGLFVAVAASMSGRRNRMEFAQAIQDIKSNIEQVINEAASGYYADASSFGCTPNLATGPQLSNTHVEPVGTNRCMFLGKAIQFNLKGTSREGLFKTYTIVGNQQDAAGNEIDNYGTAAAGDAVYADTLPTVVAPSTTNVSGPDRTINGRLLYGMTMKGMRYYSDSYTYDQVTNIPATPDVVTGTPGVRGYFDGSGDGPVDNNERDFSNFGIDLNAIYGNPPRPVRGMDRFELYLCAWYAPASTGWYTFGGWADDKFTVRVGWNNPPLGGWNTGPGSCRDGTPWQWPTHFVYEYRDWRAQYQQSVYLEKGKAYPMFVDLWNYGGASYIYVTANGSVIPSSDIFMYRPVIQPGTPAQQIHTPINVPTALKDINTIAFTNNLASYGSDTLLTGGPQSLNMVPVNNTGSAEISPTDPQYDRKIADAIATWFRDKTPPGATKAPFSINPTEGVTMCFVSDGTDQSGLITVGGGGRQLSVTLKISDGKTCGGLYP